MLTYSFGFYESVHPLTREVHKMPRLGVEDPYGMLSYLGDNINQSQYVEEIEENLEQVLKGKADGYSWGVDMAMIYSGSTVSIVEYLHDTEKGVKESQLDVPTDWLLKLLKDWKGFLMLHKL